MTAFDKAVTLKTEFWMAWANRGSVLANLERYEEAILS